MKLIVSLPSVSRPYKCQARRDWWDAEGGTRPNQFHSFSCHVWREIKRWGGKLCVFLLCRSSFFVLFFTLRVIVGEKKVTSVLMSSSTQSCLSSSLGSDPEETILNAFKVFDPEGNGVLQKDRWVTVWCIDDIEWGEGPVWSSSLLVFTVWQRCWQPKQTGSLPRRSELYSIVYTV